MKSGFVSEIYSTLQGEGIYAGERQIFVRLAGCPLRCHWCDTPGSLSSTGHPSLDTDEVLNQISKLHRGTPVQTVSFTGGEPLAQVDFLSSLLPAVKSGGWKVYLETAGVHPKALERVVHDCDVVSMDIKLPSAVGKPYWKEHAEFLKIAGRKAFVKIVVDQYSQGDEMKKSFEIIAENSPHSPLVIQPVTPIAPLSSRLTGEAAQRIEPPDPPKILLWHNLAKAFLSDVRVLPQMHPIWGLP